MKLFRRKITPEYIRKHYHNTHNGNFYSTFDLGKMNNGTHLNHLFIQIRDNDICLLRGSITPSYWICDIEYIYQLKQMLKIYKIL